MTPADMNFEHTERRRNAVAQGTASPRAEGLEPPAEIQFIIDKWMLGQCSTREMEGQVAGLYHLRGDNEPLHRMLDDLITDDQP